MGVGEKDRYAQGKRERMYKVGSTFCPKIPKIKAHPTRLPVWFELHPVTKMLQVQFLVRAHTLVAHEIQVREHGRQLIYVSLSHQCFFPSPPLCLPVSLKSNEKMSSG